MNDPMANVPLPGGMDESTDPETPSFPEIVVTDAPDAGDVALIADSLTEFNAQVTGFNDHRPLAVLVRDPQTHRVLGGLTGRTSLGLLFVDLFHLPRELRGSGLGGEILRRAEAEGRRRGCRSAVLYTISFQAPDFYKRHGWQVFGEIPCDPPGTTRVFMTKDLR
ncbi:N-acetyltransferase [Longispora fulva]|uniref:GNAT superfamily N-acetyltransferase n=1 Tax=Longispora fulva TaxID=619741 RepID=A0A8J7KVV8_9ACTN|nr:GNAT family N-acetyltransferase [Longispora fulva]MBG6135782.1 GNAT superfamily N-acetyltransferase [Longispora fulva]GIG55977.1 N-acetyltransferase [Longispora fulva]